MRTPADVSSLMLSFGPPQRETHFIPLDVVLSYIAPGATVPEVRGLSFEPPPIFVSSTPAILVMTDGEPILAIALDGLIPGALALAA